MTNAKPSLPKGTRDFGPEESAKRSYIIETIRKNFAKYGFSQIETPAMEQLSVLTGKYGDEGDQLLFKILNSGDFLSKVKDDSHLKDSKALLPDIAEKGLRYDLTVPFARFVVQNQHALTFPFKRFQIQPVWRADRPQKGRYREFYQCDADIIGSKSLWNEVELTRLVADVYADLNYDGYLLKVNHREVLFGLAEYVGLKGKETAFCVVIDKLDKIGSDKVTQELFDLGGNRDGIIKLIKELFQGNGDFEHQIAVIEKLLGSSNNGIVDLKKYLELLKLSGVMPNIELDLSLARGLSYYTGMIFEVKARNVQIGSITGGGRYDNLTGVFGLPDVSGVGISFGLDRIYDVLTELDLFPPSLSTNIDLLIVHFDEASFRHGISILNACREAGISTELYPEPVKIKKQFNYADKKNIPFVVVIGSEEIQKEQYSLKNLKDGSQDMFSLNQIIERVKSNLK